MSADVGAALFRFRPVSNSTYQDDQACVESTNITSSCENQAVINVDDGKTLVIESNYNYCAIQ